MLHLKRLYRKARAPKSIDKRHRFFLKAWCYGCPRIHVRGLSGRFRYGGCSCFWREPKAWVSLTLFTSSFSGFCPSVSCARSLAPQRSKCAYIKVAGCGLVLNGWLSMHSLLAKPISKTFNLTAKAYFESSFR